MNHVSAYAIFDQPFEIDKKLFAAAEETAHALGKVSGISSDIFDDSYIIEALKNIEALTSAQIEGTTGDLKDLYLDEALSFEKKKELKMFSAINYKQALNQLEKMVRDHKTINHSFLKQMHQVLVKHDPATKGSAGAYRINNVRIAHSKLGDFYPPAHTHVQQYMDRFFAEINEKDKSSLFDIALHHYQFEAIHPFEDGNGRTGRLLVMTELLQHGFITSPALHLSQYFEAHRDEYIERLRAASEQRDSNGWVFFFLEGVRRQAVAVAEIVQQLQDIRKNARSTLAQHVTGTSIPLYVLDYALEHLYLSVPEVRDYIKASDLEVKDPYQVARASIKRMVEIEILEKDHMRGRTEYFVLPALRTILFAAP